MVEITIPESELININDLKVDGANPNVMSDKQRTSLKRSIKQYCFIVPIITNKDLLIADGEQRLEVAKDLGMEKVKVIRLPIEDVDRRILRQVMNKLRGEHDLTKDAYEFDLIVQANREDDLKLLLDLSEKDMEKYWEKIREPQTETFTLSALDQIKTDIKTGDLYQLGNHRLLCGDATQEQDITTLMNGQEANVLFTDPPFDFERTDWLAPFFKQKEVECFVYHSDKNAVKLSCAYMDYFRYFFSVHLKNAPIIAPSLPKGNHHLIVYLRKGKTHFRNLYDSFGTTFEYVKIRGGLTKYQKTMIIPHQIIIHYTNYGDIVADVFGGSGTTLMACEETDRICYILELDPRCCQIIVDRWEAYDGGTAEQIQK